MKTTHQTLVTRLSSLATAVAATTAIAGDIYVNDFATRTSQGSIPAYGVVRTAQPYPTKNAYLHCRPMPGSVVYDYGSLSTYFALVTEGGFDSRPAIDGWFMPYFNDYKLVPRYLVASSSGGLADNPVFTWSYGSSTARHGDIVHSLHNEFTNGQVRIQVDMKAAVQWSALGCRVRVFPVYRKYMDILAWNNWYDERNEIADASPGRFGIRGPASGSTTSTLRSFPIYSNTGTVAGEALGNNDSGSFGDDGSNGKTNYWFRFIVTYDLDNNTFGGDLYRFSKAKGHPSFETEPSDATPYKTFSVPARTALSAATGGIAGLGIGGYGSFNGASASTAPNKCFVDNIRVSWKAPGASDFEVFYENDFETRWYKTICAPAHATMAAYAQSTATVSETDTFTGYESGSLDKYRFVPTVSGTGTQVTGLDGWRRAPFTSSMHGRPGVIAYGGTSCDSGGTGGNVFTTGDQSGISRLVQTLGTSFSSGTVRLVADFRLPEGSSLVKQTIVRRLGLGLGSAALYDATRETIFGTIAGGFGYERLNEAGPSPHRPYAIEAGGSGNEPARSYPASYTSPESNYWYRAEVAANLDAKTYTVTVTPIGDASVTGDDAATGSPIYSSGDLPFAANVTDIGSFYLAAYGYGAAASDQTYMNQRCCIDNIRVYHGSDLIYDNDFTTRTRIIPAATRETGELTAQQYNLDGGQDHWVRRDYTGSAGFDARAWVRNDNGNTFLALGRAAEGGRTILVGNELGDSVDKPFRFETDIRPPAQWSAANGFVKISLGDSQMAQTEAKEAIYGAHRLVTFGFDGTNAQNQAQCPYYFAGCTAQVGNTTLDAEIDETHWYRFRLEVNPENGTYDAQLRDMGTSHPTAETKGGTIVATATGLAFENALAAGEGISTIHIAGDGLAGAYGSLGVDPAHVLIDNLKMTIPDPFMLIVR